MLLPPQYVKPYVQRGKNDAIDAEAIYEVMGRPKVQARFVRSRPSSNRRRAVAEAVLTRLGHVRLGRGTDRDEPVEQPPHAVRQGLPGQIHVGERVAAVGRHRARPASCPSAGVRDRRCCCARGRRN